MKIFVLAFSLGVAAPAAWACDCQKNQEQKEQKQCSCGADGKQCPNSNSCNHDANQKKKDAKKG
jgi:hypothetical protein